MDPNIRKEFNQAKVGVTHWIQGNNVITVCSDQGMGYGQFLLRRATGNTISIFHLEQLKQSQKISKEKVVQKKVEASAIKSQLTEPLQLNYHLPQQNLSVSPTKRFDPNIFKKAHSLPTISRFKKLRWITEIRPFSNDNRNITEAYSPLPSYEDEEEQQEKVESQNTTPVQSPRVEKKEPDLVFHLHSVQSKDPLLSPPYSPPQLKSYQNLHDIEVSRLFLQFNQMPMRDSHIKSD